MGAGHQAFYLVKISFLGYRYHGWQKQPSLKTLHSVVDRTLKYILDGLPFKTLGASRTDAKVSAHQAAFELFLKSPIEDLSQFIDDFNANLPHDVYCESVVSVTKEFNIIQDSKEKVYQYYFAFGNKSHPFCAPFLTTILEPLDIELMIQGARLFEGTHFFKSYCYKPKPDAAYVRTISKCHIIPNQDLTASFFPKKSYVLEVKGKGFLRHQVRLMIGALFRLGKGERTLNDIKESLIEGYPYNETFVAPASGLILDRINFEIPNE